MSTDPTEDTVPVSPVTSEQPSAPRRIFFRTAPGAFFLLAILLGSVIGFAVVSGYRAGLDERNRAAATAQFAELKTQYELGIEDLAAGRRELAAHRFEYILSVDPAFPGAAARLAESQGSGVTPSPVFTLAPTATLSPQTAEQLFAGAQSAFTAHDWDAAIQRASALRLAMPDYERGQVNNILFTSLRNRGIASINAGVLELGLADLDQAEKLGTLDSEAQQYQQWATIYINGASYWGLNWPKTVETFSLLYTLAPNFRDTTARLRDAHIGYANQLNAGGDPCGAETEYAAALAITFDQITEDKRLAAETTCLVGTPTPEGTPTPDETLTSAGTPTP